MIRRKPLPRPSHPIKRSWLKRGTKPIPQENIEATKRRRARNAKRMRSPEYKSARVGAMQRSGGRCEFEAPTTFGVLRCPKRKRLQFHEERYRKVGPVTADDGKILCPPHHRLAESKKMHKWGKRGFA